MKRLNPISPSQVARSPLALDVLCPPAQARVTLTHDHQYAVAVLVHLRPASLDDEIVTRLRDAIMVAISQDQKLAQTVLDLEFVRADPPPRAYVSGPVDVVMQLGFEPATEEPK